MTATNGTVPTGKKVPEPAPTPPYLSHVFLLSYQGTFLFTSESVGEGHPDKIW